MFSAEELSMTPTEELVAALKRRCRGLVLIMSYVSRDGEEETRESWMSGGHYHCIGLLESVKLQIQQGELTLPNEDSDPNEDDWKNE